jgi:hypothetical protein
MPRIKDLGINIVPGTMRPPEIGGGGGGCLRTMRTECPDISQFQLSEDPCRCITAEQCGHGLTCRFMSCRWHTDKMESDPGCTCITTPNLSEDTCQCISAGNWQGHGHGCRVSQCTITQPHNLTPQTPRLPPGSLSRDQIAALRAQLRNHLENLDQAEKNLLPKTVEEADAREQELQRELEMLKKHRDELKKQ